MRHLNEEILEDKRVSRVGGSAQGVGPLTDEELSFARLFAVAFLLLFYEHPVFYCGTRVLAPVRLSKCPSCLFWLVREILGQDHAAALLSIAP